MASAENFPPINRQNSATPQPQRRICASKKRNEKKRKEKKKRERRLPAGAAGGCQPALALAGCQSVSAHCAAAQCARLASKIKIRAHQQRRFRAFWPKPACAASHQPIRIVTASIFFTLFFFVKRCAPSILSRSSPHVRRLARLPPTRRSSNSPRIFLTALPIRRMILVCVISPARKPARFRLFAAPPSPSSLPASPRTSCSPAPTRRTSSSL